MIQSNLIDHINNHRPIAARLEFLNRCCQKVNSSLPFSQNLHKIASYKFVNLLLY